MYYTGCYHSVCAHQFCGCEQEAETLLRLQLFPATPEHPQLAFDFSLLDWFEALLLECQMSAQDFVATLSALNMLSSGQLMRVRIFLMIIAQLSTIIHIYVVFR